MRAVAATQYGGPETYSVSEVPDPTTGPDRIVVKVEAASINPVDYKILAGALDGAFPVVWPIVPGWDVAGEVLAVGPAVSALRPELVPGAKVFGYARLDFVGAGTWAQQVAMPMRGLALAPQNLDAAHASCLPLAGLTAYQLLTEAVAVQPGECVLIHAASGGVGHLAVQIARSLGATVIGSASAKNQEFVRGLGAQAVEYGDGLPAQVRELAPDGVDAVLDLVGGLAIEQTPDLLGPNGRWATITDATRAAELGGSYVFVRPDPVQLAELARLADSGAVVPRVHAVHDLDAVSEAVTES
ncbi:MAG: NADP-dependent oxidoreductase, partial [Candidatus Nanopelagicales bacterium]